MSAISNVLPFTVGTTVGLNEGGPLAANLGQLYKTFDTTNGERIFRLVKADSTDLLINSQVKSAVSGGKKTWVVSVANAPSSYMAGVIPLEYTATITASSYFLLQAGGNVPILAGDTVFSSLSGVESRLVAGSAGSGYARQLAAFTTASTTEEYGVFALASNSVAATAAGQTVRCLLKIALDG